MSATSDSHTLTALFAQRRYAEALPLAETQVNRYPQDGANWNTLGAVLMKLGRGADALVAMQKAAELSAERPEAHFNLATAYRQNGRLEESEAAFKRAIDLRPDYAEAYNNLGNVLSEADRLAGAEAAFRSAIGIKPDYARAYNNLGLVLKRAGRVPESGQAFRRAILLKPDFAEADFNLRNLLNEEKLSLDQGLDQAIAHHQAGRMREAESLYRVLLETSPNEPRIVEAWFNLGILMHEGGRLSEAEAAFRRATELAPGLAEAYNSLGQVYQATGRASEAESAFRRAITLKPGFVEAHNNLGLLAHAAGRMAEAEAAFRLIIELRPDDVEAHNNLAFVLQDTKRLSEAEESFRSALALKPDMIEGYNNLGVLLQEARRMDEAEAALRQALDLQPDYVGAYNNLGVLLDESRRYAESEAAYRRALELQPDYVDAHHNLGSLLAAMRRYPEAESAFHRALELKADCPDARYGLSFLLLSLGRYEEGWLQYEARYAAKIKSPCAVLPDLPYPQWRGEPLRGKSLVICPEQGFGDQIQFVRYAAALKRLGLRRLTWACPPALKSLLESVKEIDIVASDRDAAFPLHDYWSFPLSLPLHLGTTLDSIPAQLPYLRTQPSRREHWRNRLPAQGGKVGVVWKGNPKHKNDANRSLAGLASLAPLWSVPGISFVSLQKGEGENEARQPPSGQPILPLGPDLADFADTAALVAELDLVICVDTSVAHIAGALGKPCWVLLPATATDWRWLLDRTDSPWYPGVMRLFRQAAHGDWDTTIAEAAAELHAWARSRAAVPDPR